VHAPGYILSQNHLANIVVCPATAALLYADVARDAADIVLMDDEFPSIVNAIEEGRVIYDNLKKTIAYTLAHAVPEVLPLFLNLVLNFPLGELPARDS
jgi:sodium/potassium-transporting ATPase subunit alpha